MNKLKLVTIIGTRPEIIRLSEVIKACDEVFNHVLIHTGQNYDYTLNQIFFEDLHLRKPDIFLDCATPSLGETLGNIISKTYDCFIKEKPDALLVLGDTNSALSVIPAKRLKIPIFHMEAGNRCFDQNVPEEINRRIVDHTADVNLTYTKHAYQYLLDEGINKAYTFVTGSPMTEVIEKNQGKIDASNILDTLKIEKGKYMVVSAHREENVDNIAHFTSLMEAINAVAKKYQMPIIFSTHPRSKKSIEKNHFVFDKLINNIAPLSFSDYNQLQKNAFCVLSDSGTLSEESAILKFPAVLIRTSTERPEAIEKGSVVLGGISTETILSGINLATSRPLQANLPSDYIDTNISQKVVQIIQGYTQIINQNIWRK